MTSATSSSLPAEDLGEVIETSEKTQRQFGDCLPKTEESQLKEMGSLDLSQNDLTNLSEIWLNWSIARQEQFNEKYGHIAFLIFVKIEESLLRAMIQFWDPPYRCFTFNEIDMTPTIEEYATLLNTLEKASDKVYRYESKQKFKRKLARIMGIHADKISPAIKEKGKNQCVSWDFLHSFIQQHLDDEKGMKVMALAIYGLIIFPNVKGYIDGKVIDFFEQVDHGANPVPSIIAETFRSLNHCRTKGEGRFIGCAQLLHMWMKSHFKCLDNKFMNIYRKDKVPIEEFCSSTWPEPLHKHGWIETFQNLSSQEVVWIAPWMAREYTVYRCGDFFWVPLLGPWGGISHAPAMVRRQLGSKQFIPMTHGLSQFEFSYGDEAATKTAKEITEAWKQAHRVKPGKYTFDVTYGYSSWHARRGKGFLAPKVNHSDPLSHMTKDPEDPYIAMEARYELATNELQTENTALTFENRRLQTELEGWKQQAEQAKKRARRLHRYINSVTIKKGELEKENAELYDTAQKLARKVEKLGKGIEALRVDLNIRILERDEAVMRSHNFQTSMIDLNHQVLVQQNRIQALMRECELLEIYCQDMDALKNGCGLLYGQAERLTTEIRNVAEKAQEMAERTNHLRSEVIPEHAYGQQLIHFLDDLHKQLVYVGKFI